MISDYKRGIIRNDARRLIGKYNDEQLEIFVKCLSAFINGSETSHNDHPVVPLIRPNKR